MIPVKGVSKKMRASEGANPEAQGNETEEASQQEYSTKQANCQDSGESFYVKTPEIIANVLGPSSAAVWGVIYGYCKDIEDGYGYCYATHENIGKKVGLSRQAVWRHIHRLIVRGYVKDITPKWKKGQEHQYIVTNKVTMPDKKKGS